MFVVAVSFFMNINMCMHIERWRENAMKKTLWKKITTNWNYLNLKYPTIAIILLEAISLCPEISLWLTGSTGWRIGFGVFALGFLFYKYNKRTFCSLASDCNDPANANEHMKMIHKRETWLRVFRVSRYIILLTVYVLFQFNIIGNPENFTWGVLSAAFFLFIYVLNGINRLTFRTWPTTLIAFAITLLYLALWGQLYDPRSMWGLPFDTVKLIENIDVAANIVTGSLISAAVLSLIVYFGRDIYQKHKDGSQVDSAKDTRRLLITHWHFHPKFLISNPFVLIIGIFVSLSVLFASFQLVGLNSADDEKCVVTENTASGSPHAKHEKHDHKTGTPGPDSKGKIPADANNAETDSSVDTEASNLSFEVYLFLLSCAFVTAGFSACLEISDKSLLQSEYFYLLYHSPQLLGKLECNFKKEKYKRRWLDFFQVLSNLYANSEAIESENMEWHKLEGIFFGLFNSLSSCGKTMLYTRSVYAFEEVRMKQRAKVEGDSALDKSAISVPDVEFSKLCALEHTQKDYFDDTPVLNYIQTLQRTFFTPDVTKEWAMLLGHSTVAIKDFIRVVQMDVFNAAISLQSEENHCLCWLCTKARCPICCDKRGNIQLCDMENCEESCNKKEGAKLCLHYKRLFLLEYPFMVFACAKRRWPNAAALEDEEQEKENGNDQAKKDENKDRGLFAAILRKELYAYYGRLLCSTELNSLEVAVLLKKDWLNAKENIKKLKEAVARALKSIKSTSRETNVAKVLEKFLADLASAQGVTHAIRILENFRCDIENNRLDIKNTHIDIELVENASENIKQLKRALEEINQTKKEFRKFLDLLNILKNHPFSADIDRYNRNIQDALANYDTPGIKDMLQISPDTLKYLDEINRAICLLVGSDAGNIKIGIEDYLFCESEAQHI